MRKRQKIIFMGTPEFSVPPLKALAAAHDISLVITQPDRPKGRGRKLSPPPVKEAALELGIEVFQPKKISGKDEDAILEKLKALEPDFFVVVAYGHKLSRKMLDIPTIYPINIHASLLPAYRGSSPIQAAIMNMDKESGVTTMIMDTDLDTGDMLLKAVTQLTEDETAQTLHDRLSIMGAELIIKTLEGIADNTITPEPQDHSKATFAPMLKKEDGRIDWCMEPEEISAQVRAMTPWPGAFTFINDKRIRVMKVRCMDIKSDEPPGTVINCTCDEIHVRAGSGAIAILELQGASGKCLCSEEYLRGNRLGTGECFL
ncbi:10-formyltetrahydrofolate:L-methionyl-tRNA(fMet) N-formyltransferase [Desulfamplus magnetovallimortis]|uniref:Methionyl-tRNA formyltransferase n=1 Tax=Desulfamplus magnetovallimortis TaxID=1246637 RepID=A0A1W1HJC7_9BACT|nr:methionyl-tRNA formyltransferase [Desulfamplus magnetovallimortis]SLM32482.1 10-formyltetrahydrofolate:L-methionyl-tRNA(fMet) N-formyltransferase [Desulfamplus magnetovallimortis]